MKGLSHRHHPHPPHHHPRCSLRYRSRRRLATQLFTLISNDLTGARASSSVPINGNAFALGTIFPWAMNLWKNGKLVATSAQHNNPGLQKASCIIKDGNTGREVRLANQVTFADLDEQVRAVETDVTGFVISCTQ